MRDVRTTIGWGLMGLLLTLPALAREPWTKEDFIQQADLVFVGKLIDQEGFWDESHRLILTRHTFYVEEALSGSPESLVEITEYGGIVGDVGMSASHTTRYVRGQEYLVFAYRDSRQRNRTLAGPLGQFQIVTGTGGARMVKVYPTHPLARLSDQSGAGGVFRTLENFSGGIRAALRPGAGSRD